ncbi:MAG: BlaI family transcriptional regulator [Clostridiales bacterium GWF2_38_85]|nr:MAG: BlaI family transcriptional regulator [Clostridiales bacterium GWF2_38_85]HBL83456.1 BlaI family transcriptional regulator [Clostridiales bacterium]
MDQIKVFDSELKVMEIIWANEPVTAKQVAAVAGEQIGWNKNTTYTIIKKLIYKNAVVRTEPNFVCTTTVSKSEVVKTETKSLIDKLFGGSKKAFFAALLDDKKLTKEEIDELREMIDKHI